jgi:sulfur relay (sulfurtransferase) complex TusBCD TusD component (DsrE family)
MKTIGRLMLALGLVVAAAAQAVAGDSDPLFINLTTDDGHRANMALNFGTKQMERGHPLTVFLNDKGVYLGSKAGADKLAEQQKAIGELVGKGATVIVCPLCMKHYGVAESDLLGGLQVGNPELTGGLLFKDGTQTLTW